jgi:hypothetical protein
VLQDRYQRVLIDTENSSKYYSGWEQLKHGVPLGSILGSLLFLYVNELSKFISHKSNPVLFASDTSIVFTNSSSLAFMNNINEVFREISD